MSVTLSSEHVCTAYASCGLDRWEGGCESHESRYARHGPRSNLCRLNAVIDRELHQTYVHHAHRRAEYEERRLHLALKIQHAELERRVRHLPVLNKLFREHRRQRFAVVQASQQSASSMAVLAEQASALAKQARSQALPELSNILGIDQTDEPEADHRVKTEINYPARNGLAE